MPENRSLIPQERIERSILVIRGQKVMLDHDLASLYDVETKRLLEAVKRNLQRFPDDFMFQLTWEELKILRSLFATSSIEHPERSRSQNATLKRGQNVKYRPYPFTEQGVAMLSSVLRSPRAVSVNIEIMRAFVRLRQMLVITCRSGAKGRGPGEKVRWSVQGCLRCLARTDATATREIKTSDWIPCEEVSRAVMFELQGCNTMVPSCIYLTLFSIACGFGVFLSLGAQPGGIDQINAFLSPILGPWSRFLAPNALTLKQCTLSYLVYSGALTAMLFVFVPSSCVVKNYFFRRLSIGIGFLSTIVWVLYGLRRICIDLM